MSPPPQIYNKVDTSSYTQEPYSNLEHYRPETKYPVERPPVPVYATFQPDQLYAKWGDAPATQAENKSKILGMRRTTFALVVAIIALVIAGAVGGGVGASRCNAKSSSGTCTVEQLADIRAADARLAPFTTVYRTSTVTADPTSTVATSVAAASVTNYSPPDIETLDFDKYCPSQNGAKMRIFYGTSATFTIFCDQDYQPDPATPRKYPDIAALTVVDLASCLRACQSYNRNQDKVGCLGVTFSTVYKRAVQEQNGNCFLKYYTGNMKASPFKGTSIIARLDT